MSTSADGLASTEHEKNARETLTEIVLASENESIYGEDSQRPTLTSEQERRLWRKIDIRLMPIVSAMYLCSFLDRGNIGNARLQGLTTQLNLTGNKFNIAITMYFVSYYVFAIFANLVLKKFRPSRWLGGITITWGIITTLMGLVKSYPQLVGVRACLGIAESGLGCGVFYHFSLWYPRHMLQTRIALIFGGATFAGAFSGLLAFGISFMSGTGGLLGWSWIFIIEGLFTVAVGIMAVFVLPDLPGAARFLSSEERSYLMHRLKYDNSSVGEEEHFELRHVREAFLDWQVWSLSLINVVSAFGVYGISLFLPSIINGFGFDATISQLLTVPPYVIATITVILWGIWSDRLKKRSPFVLAGFSLSLIGYAINLSPAPISAKYFGTFLVVTGAYSGFPAIAAWLPNNLAGHYKRGVGIGIQIMFSGLGGVVVSNIYRTQDAPRYILGHALELMFLGLGILLVLATALTYARINRRRDALQREADEKGPGVVRVLTPEELRRLGDRAPDFRYTL
ncbi:MFS general substrate transporter [Earliella scabrosa]|nr:MFS general substrate transporter [Earliella scabrosa]